MSDRIIYLARFQQPYRHARHYLGSTEDLGRRLEEHRGGRGARLMEVIQAHGIGSLLARTWRGSRILERFLKRRKGTPRLCPICRGRLQGSHIETNPGAVEREETEKEFV
ncbi:MAG: endonuclease [Gammaproteobacteria bacterium]